MQWIQWSLVQKGQTHVVDAVDALNFGSKRSNPLVDAVDALNFGSKRSNPFSGHSMQWMQYTVDAVE